MKNLLAAFLLLMAPLSQASQIDHGTWIEDSGTGMDWLKLTETAGVSYDNRASISYLSEGWRHASLLEIEALFIEFGGVANASSSTYAGVAQSFLNTFGPNYIDTYGSWMDYVWGFSADADPSNAGYQFAPWVAVDDVMAFGSDPVSGIFSLNSPTLDSSYGSGYADSTMGHWLVRETAVPAPAGAAFLFLGLVALGIRQQQKS